MGLTSLDIIVLLLVGGAALLGVKRGFVFELFSLAAWIGVLVGLKIAHTPLTATLADPVGSTGGAAVLAFALITGIVYFGGRMIATRLGARVKSSVLGPVDRALGFGFGALKGLIGASLVFLLLVLVTDTFGGGPRERPDWVTTARTYPLLNATSGSVADFIDRRRKGESIFAEGNAAAPANASAPE